MMRRAALAMGALVALTAPVSAAAAASGASSAVSTKVSYHHPTCHKTLARTASNPWCPFGVLGVLPAPREHIAADVGSAPLPDSTRAVNLVADLQDPSGEGFFDEYAVTQVKPVDPVEGQVDGCLISGAAFSAKPIAFSFSGKSTLLACATLAERLHSVPRSCHSLFVPGFANGASPTRAVIKEATKRMQDSMSATCTRPHKTQIGVGLRAPAGQTLNGVLGLRAHSATGAFVRSGIAPGRKSRLVFGWGVTSG